MLRGIYSAATGMITQTKKINVLGNNIANVNTAGFKRDEIVLKSFDEELTTRLDDGTQVGSLSVGASIGGVSVDFTQGPMEQTNLATDLAITGNGFFAVEALPGSGGVKYTRDGNFQVDAQGFLALASGERLLSSDGNPLYTGGNGFAVSRDGKVNVSGNTLGNIALYCAQDGTYAKRSDGFFNIATPMKVNGSIMQGYVENSNVDAVDEMTGLMQAQRSFQSCQQAFQTAGQTLDKLINQVGSLRG
jgi:flagellar basal-body rod protein FlgF